MDFTRTSLKSGQYTNLLYFIYSFPRRISPLPYLLLFYPLNLPLLPITPNPPHHNQHIFLHKIHTINLGTHLQPLDIGIKSRNLDMTAKINHSQELKFKRIQERQVNPTDTGIIRILIKEILLIFCRNDTSSQKQTMNIPPRKDKLRMVFLEAVDEGEGVHEGTRGGVHEFEHS